MPPPHTNCIAARFTSLPPYGPSDGRNGRGRLFWRRKVSGKAAAPLSSTEPWIRLATFAAIFATLALWEIVAPARARTCPRGKRWPANVGVTVLGAVAVRLLFPTAAVGMALIAQEHGWGLLNAVHLPRAA